MKNTEIHNERAIDRLKIFSEYAKNELKVVKGQNSFEAYCGLSNGYIASLDRGRRSKGSIGSDVIARVSKAFPMLNLKWLCSGEGEMIDDGTKAEQELRYIKRKLDIIKKIVTS